MSRPLPCTDQILLFIMARDQHKLFRSEAAAAAAATTLELQKYLIHEQWCHLWGSNVRSLNKTQKPLSKSGHIIQDIGAAAGSWHWQQGRGTSTAASGLSGILASVFEHWCDLPPPITECATLSLWIASRRFGHNKLWLFLVMNSLFVTFQIVHQVLVTIN